MPTTTDHHLHLVPGRNLVLFFVRLGGTRSLLTVPAARFLEGLQAACNLLSFTELQRFEDAPLEELLPWAGNV